ncbi:MAG TPA: hypothetical protein PKZ12_06250, partial [Smithellaceae bacterium]|nr:hypothetical protein [Smithellaceae bacterium]
MIILIGLNHMTAPLALREKLFAGCEEKKNLLAELLAIAGVREAMYLTTCNRVEILAVIDGCEGAERNLCAYPGKVGSLTTPETEKCLYVHREEAAVRHLFRVASSLDSMIMGEAQILGQVKEAYRRALEAHATGAVMNRLLHRAFRTAKRVRT